MSTTPLNVVGVSGSLNPRSRTTALIEAILASLARATEIDSHIVTVDAFAGSLSRKQLTTDAEAELQRIEAADLLVVATPVYRASYTGLFKHVWDLVGQNALIDTPMLLGATGGSDLHSLVIEHELRPLFGFFQALTLPVGLYARDTDIVDYRVTDEFVEKIDAAVERSLPLVQAGQRVTS
jgi:FMN reductase